MKSILQNTKFLVLFALIVPAVVIFHRLGESPLAGDDCYYSEVSKEMAASGDYLTPRNAGIVDFHTSKPPMLFWMNALSGKLFGFNTAAMRLPSAMLGYLGVVALFFFCRRYFGLETAFLSSIILTFTQQYLYHSRSAVTDGPFAVFFAFSLFAFWAARSEHKAYFYYLFGFFLGLAVMTRQLPGFFIYTVILAYMVLAKDYKALKEKHFYGAILLSFAVILPWHIIMYAKYGMAFIKQYFGVALMTGITGYPESYSSNPSLNPWYAYFEILLSNYQPWLIFVVIGLYRIFRKFGSFEPERKKQLIFALAWCFAPLLVFQAAKVKQYHYIMPLYIPFAIISAYAISDLGEKAKFRITAGLAAIAVCLAAAYIVYPVIPKTLDSREYVENLKLVPELKKTEGDVYILKHGSSYFNNCFWFYADKRSVPCSDSEFAGLFNAPQKRVFAVLKEDLAGIKSLLAKPAGILKETEDSVLFTN